eukprot:1066017-Pelagomonas_calceolata.AAC.6
MPEQQQTAAQACSQPGHLHSIYACIWQGGLAEALRVDRNEVLHLLCLRDTGVVFVLLLADLNAVHAAAVTAEMRSTQASTAAQVRYRQPSITTATGGSLCCMRSNRAGRAEGDKGASTESAVA